MTDDGAGLPRVLRMDASLVDAFFRLHDDRSACGDCYCVAWWVPTWEEWEGRTEGQNRALREDLFARGEFDGYLMMDGATPIGWCQVGPRDRLEKLRVQHALEPDPETWAISCFVLRPEHRRCGLAHQMLAHVLDDLRARGVAHVEAFPRLETGLPDDDVWTGPAALFEAAGFQRVGGGGRRAVMRLRLV